MGLETGTYISDLVAANPDGGDPKSEGDDHIRLLKSTIKATFPNVNGEVNRTPAQLNKAGVDASETTTGIAEIATQAETDAGTDDARMVTPKKLRNGFAVSLSGSGYVTFPSWLGGLIINWGSWTSSATPGNPVTVSFPQPYTNVWGVYMSVVNPSTTTSSVWMNSLVTGGFNGRTNIASTACFYIAIGN